MSSIYLSQELKTRLIAGARRRGFKVERGPASELKDYVAYLLALDEERPSTNVGSNLSRARGLLSVSNPPDDEEVARLLTERFLSE